jgi:glycosyltransferase involved in cell wall biosynthesis
MGSCYDAVFLSRVDVAKEIIEVTRRCCRNAKLIFDTVDLHFVRESRQAVVEKGVASARRKGEELAVAWLADLTLVVSEAEKELLRREAPQIAVDVVTLIEEPDPTETGFEEREGLIFIANFRHLPNCDGLEYYLRHIHPLVRDRLGGAKLTVIGADPPGRLEELADEGVRFAGHVEDLRSEFAKARVMIAPLRFGAGIKGKVCTSMSLGVPVVATSVGVEGMTLENREDALIADTPKAFAEAVVAAYSDPDLWSRLVRNGLRKVATQFSPQRAEVALARILEIPRR